MAAITQTKEHLTSELSSASAGAIITKRQQKRVENTFGSISQFLKFCISTGLMKMRVLNRAELLGPAILPRHVVAFCKALSLHKGVRNQTFAKATLHTMVACLKRFFHAYNRAQACDGGTVRVSQEVILQITKLTEQFKSHARKGIQRVKSRLPHGRVDECCPLSTYVCVCVMTIEQQCFSITPSTNSGRRESIWMAK